MNMYTKSRTFIGALMAASLLGGAALADETVKVGIIGPFSGGFVGSFGEPFRQGVETFVAQHGDPMPGVKVELIWRDLPGTDPAAAKAKTLELVTKDKVRAAVEKSATVAAE